MARLIDADVAIERAKQSDKIVRSSIWETGEVVEFLEDEPIVDAVPVVRCRDCVSRVHDKASNEYWCDNPGGLGGRLRDDTFCPYGERKTMTEREQLFELLDEVHHRHLGKEYRERLTTIADQLLSNGVTLQRWIPVTERLPEIYDKDPEWSKTVLFRTAEGHIHSGYRNIGRQQTSFYDDDWTPPYWLDESENFSFEEDEITHWMPLPTPPKEETT